MTQHRSALFLLGFALGCARPAPSGDTQVTSEPSPTVAAADAYLVGLAHASPETGTERDLAGTDHGALTDNTEAGIARREPPRFYEKLAPPR